MMSATSTPVPPRSLRPRWSLGLLATVAAAAVYLNCLHNPFVYDDHRLIVDNTSLSALPDLSAIVAHEITRPLVNLSYAADRAFWGPDPFGFHVTNVLLHVLNVGLVFGLVWRLADDGARTTRDARSPSSANLVAGTTALILAVNPMMTQAVGYISGRAELLCATFALSALGSARRYIATGRGAWWMATATAWILAMLSKEVGAVVPVLLLSYDLLASPRSALSLRERMLRLHAPLLTAMLVAGAARVWVLRTIEYPAEHVDPTFVLVQLEAVRRYALLLFGQGPQSIFHQIAPYQGLASARALLTLGTIPVAVAAVWLLGRIDRLASLGSVWFLLCLVPSSALFVLGRGEAMAEHRVYVASIGFFLAIGAVVGRAGLVIGRQRTRTRRLAGLVASVLVAQLAMHTVLRNQTWSSPVTLWSDAVARAPGHWLPHLMLGEAFREAGQCTAAVPEYRTAIGGDPGQPFGYARLGACLITLEQFDDAASVFQELDSRSPGSAEAAAGLGLVAMAEDRLDDAQTLLRESVRRDGDNAPVRQLLAALEARARPGYATAFCQQMRSLAPRSRAATECEPWNH